MNSSEANIVNFPWLIFSLDANLISLTPLEQALGPYISEDFANWIGLVTWLMSFEQKRAWIHSYYRNHSQG